MKKTDKEDKEENSYSKQVVLDFLGLCVFFVVIVVVTKLLRWF